MSQISSSGSGGGTGTITSITFNNGLTSTPNPITTIGTAGLIVTNLITDGTVYWDGTTLHSVALGTSGQVLQSQGAAMPPIFANAASTSITLTGDVGSSTGTSFTISGGTTGLTETFTGSTLNLGGTLNIAHGGTNATSFAVTDGTIYYDGTRLVTTATGTSNFVLTSNGVGVAPTYQAVSASGAVTSVSGGNNITITGTATAPIVNVSGTTNHSVLLGNVTGSINSLANGTTGTVLHAVTGANDPIWSAVSLTADVSGILPIANGGTNASSFAVTDGTAYFDGTRLVTTATGTANQVLTSNGAGVAPTYQAVSASGAVTSVNAGANTSITGTATAPIVNVAGTTNHAVQVGTGSTGLTQISVGATNTVLLGNTGADPSFGAVPNAALVNSSITLSNGNNITVTGSPVSLGGTASFNLTGTTTNAVQIGNAGGSLTSIAIGTTGQVLTGVTAGAPVFAAPAASSISITGDTGGALTGAAFTIFSNLATINAGETVSFSGSGTTLTFNVTDGSSSTVIGKGAGKAGSTGAGGNTALGSVALASQTSAAACTVIGNFAGNKITTGNNNTAVGDTALQNITTHTDNTAIGHQAYSSGDNNQNTVVGSQAMKNGSFSNVAIGYQAMTSLGSSGNQNVAIGSTAGSAYVGSESNNIIIGNAVTGTAAETATTRIGVFATQTKCFIAGIQGVATSNPLPVVINSATGQLGTTTTGVTATWSTITVNQTAAVANGYFCNKAGTLALALPATSAVGDIIEVVNINTATGTSFTQAASQQIFFGNTSTTLGATGTLTSTSIGDTMKLVCRTANLTWQVLGNPIGNWTVV